MTVKPPRLSAKLLTSAFSSLGILLLALPAEAARLQFWRFDSSNNQLVVVTDVGVQPRIQLILNPTRLIVDLPSTTLGRQTVRQPLGGTFQELRVGQFDAQTTRLVVELSPSYSVDPQQIRVRGATASQWIVELPTPRLANAISPAFFVADKAMLDLVKAGALRSLSMFSPTRLRAVENTCTVDNPSLAQYPNPLKRKC